VVVERASSGAAAARKEELKVRAADGRLAAHRRSHTVRQRDREGCGATGKPHRTPGSPRARHKEIGGAADPRPLRRESGPFVVVNAQAWAPTRKWHGAGFSASEGGSTARQPPKVGHVREAHTAHCCRRRRRHCRWKDAVQDRARAAGSDVRARRAAAPRRVDVRVQSLHQTRDLAAKMQAGRCQLGSVDRLKWPIASRHAEAARRHPCSRRNFMDRAAAPQACRRAALPTMRSPRQPID